MQHLKIIVFDWDGTLMDSEAAIVAAMSEAYRRINKWDAMLTSDIEEQLNAPRTVDGWNDETLSVDT